MKRFVKILIINYFISLFEVFIFNLALWARSGYELWSWDSIVTGVFVLTQTILITLKYWFTIGKIEIKDD